MMGIRTHTHVPLPSPHPHSAMVMQQVAVHGAMMGSKWHMVHLLVLGKFGSKLIQTRFELKLKPSWGFSLEFGFSLDNQRSPQMVSNSVCSHSILYYYTPLLLPDTPPTRHQTHSYDPKFTFQTEHHGIEHCSTLYNCSSVIIYSMSVM